MQMRKIIHIDMDCFYAAVEIRDNPSLADKPVAIGAPASQRGVLCTCNYVARKYGVRSAMPTATALRYCNELIVLPVNIEKYRIVAKQIQDIFTQFTDIVEPLALDEAYLDVTACREYEGSATRIAEAIRKKIWEDQGLVASAGVAPNKFLAKIGSGWKKPNGLFVIRPEDIDDFVKDLKVENLYGVGKVTARKFHQLKLATCRDLQNLSFQELVSHFGRLGERLYQQCRGIDLRPVNPDQVRKSLSVEETFSKDIYDQKLFDNAIIDLHLELITRIKNATPDKIIKKQFIKIKFYDFKATSMEMINAEANLEYYHQMFNQCFKRFNKPVRLIGIGVNFKEDMKFESKQQSLF